MSSTASFIYKFIFSLLFLSAIAVLISWVWYQNSLKAVTSENIQKVKVVIPKGYSVKQIGELLQEKGLIKNTLSFRIFVKLNNFGDKLQAGSYQLDNGQSLAQTVDELTSGKEEDFWITIPEGKRREEIALILQKDFANHNLNFDTNIFLDLTKNLEGYLFPDTYLFPKTIDEAGVVKILTNNFDKKVPVSLRNQTNDLGLDFRQILTIASLIEREAKFAVDRPKIAGVIYNRLGIGMALQIDASIQYGMANVRCKNTLDCDWWSKNIDLKFESPYNLYLHNNLPPTPIDNPGLSAIKAALNPEHNDYLYYLSENSGKTHFSKTFKQHQNNINKYLY